MGALHQVIATRSIARKKPTREEALNLAKILPLRPASFDAVVSIAALHHMPLEAAVDRMCELVAPGGVLVIHDLRADSGLADLARLPFAVLARALARLRAGRLFANAALRAAWNDHARGERYLTFKEAAALCAKRLPLARVIGHLQWRYTATWRRPSD